MTVITRQNEHLVRKQVSDALTTAEAAIDAVEALVGSAASPTTTKLVAVLDRITADTAITNSAAETTLYTKTIDHADFNGYALKLTIAGTYLNNSGSLESPFLRVKFGATTMFSFNPGLTASASTRMWRLNLELTSRSTSSQELTSHIWVSNAAGSGSTPLVTASPMFESAATESTSGAGTKALAVTWQHGAAATTITVTLKTGLLERV